MESSGFLSDKWRKTYLPAGILGGATALQVGAGFQEASNIEAAGKANAGAYRDAAQLAGMQGQVEDSQFTRLARKLRESNRNQAAGSGFTLSGSVLDAMADTAAQLELERQLNKWKVNVEQGQLSAAATNTERMAKAQAGQVRTSAMTDLAAGLYKLTDLFG